MRPQETEKHKTKPAVEIIKFFRDQEGHYYARHDKGFLHINPKRLVINRLWSTPDQELFEVSETEFREVALNTFLELNIHPFIQ